MIDTVWFENEGGATLRPCDGAGLIMVEHDCPPPKPRTCFLTLDGADGALDLSGWAGETRYEARKVRIRLRDMRGGGTGTVVGFVTRQRVRIWFSEQPGWYYDGRCVQARAATRSRVTDLDLTFLCQPYRLRGTLTVKTLPGGTETTVRVGEMAVAASVEAPQACALSVDGEGYDLPEGRSEGALVLTPGPHRLTLSGTPSVRLTWRDGAL